MNSHLLEIFTDEALISRIQKRLPKLFRIAELESSRAGKIGMQVGSLREKVIIGLLLYGVGEDKVQTNIPITEPAVDVKLYGLPISVKTHSKSGFSGVKLKWTVDANKAREFMLNYYPACDMLFAKIVWGSVGGLYYIPVETQRVILQEMGMENYIKLPKSGTNPRGVEIRAKALRRLTRDEETKIIEIDWLKPDIDYRPYQKWVDCWSEA